jgi:hypothetical protein
MAGLRSIERNVNGLLPVVKPLLRTSRFMHGAPERRKARPA